MLKNCQHREKTAWKIYTKFTKFEFFIFIRLSLVYNGLLTLLLCILYTLYSLQVGDIEF